MKIKIYAKNTIIRGGRSFEENETKKSASAVGQKWYTYRCIEMPRDDWSNLVN